MGLRTEVVLLKKNPQYFNSCAYQYSKLCKDAPNPNPNANPNPYPDPNPDTNTNTKTNTNANPYHKVFQSI